MEIYITSKFKKAYEGLPKQIKRKVEVKEKVFRQNPHHPSLKAHSLHGKYKNYWAFSVEENSFFSTPAKALVIDEFYRIMFQFLNAAKTKVAFLNIGTHEIYK